MSYLPKLTLAFLLLAPIAVAPAMAANTYTEIELTPTGEMPGFSGLVAISPTRAGGEVLAVRVNSDLPRGSAVRVTYVKDGEEYDLAVLTFKIGSALYEIVESNEPNGVFPTGDIDAFFVYFKNLRVLEAKNSV